jgi:acyl-[acyl carrier protein]--UDP-N-acetylglucosamine O-acyltransferase
VENVVFAGDVNAGDVVVLPGASSAVLVKTVRLGRGGFIFTVAPVGDDRPQAERLVTLTAAAPLRRHGRDLSN